MAEIKSTLELVMERTRNLTLSEEEKREQATNEFATRVRGLICKVEDGLLPLDRFAAELEDLKRAFGISDDAAAIGQLIARLELKNDNSGTLQLLQVVCGGAVKEVEKLLERYRDLLEMAESEAGQRCLSALERVGISGSAVIANLSDDGEWLRAEKEAGKSFEGDLQRWMEAR